MPWEASHPVRLYEIICDSLLLCSDLLNLGVYDFTSSVTSFDSSRSGRTVSVRSVSVFLHIYHAKRFLHGSLLQFFHQTMFYVSLCHQVTWQGVIITILKKICATDPLAILTPYFTLNRFGYAFNSSDKKQCSTSSS